MISEHVMTWRGFTQDANIIQMVTGCVLEFDSLPVQKDRPRPYHFNESRRRAIDKEIKCMLEKQVIEVTKERDVGFMSNVFSRPKADGTVRVILDLTELNKHITYRHFKMDNLQSAINLMSKNCYMASIDWREAYYCVPVRSDFRKYLCFEWEGIVYRYTCMPNGLACAPRYFTKLTKVFFSHLRKDGLISTSYIDDCLLVASDHETCAANVALTAELSRKAGFVVHKSKSVLVPCRKITYLGFWLDSERMTIRLTEEKAKKIKEACVKLCMKDRCTIEALAKLVGMLVASFPGVPFAPLFYRACDNLKARQLKLHSGNFKALISIPDACKQDLRWWTGNVEHAEKSVIEKPPVLVIETDASKMGWGAVVKGDLSKTTGGNWSESESREHINYLELLAAWFGIQCFAKGFKDKHIKVCCDNTTAVAYLNKQGGTKSKCNEVARTIWLWCFQNNNWITAAHLPGSNNVHADKESRSIHDNTEWKLAPQLFQDICREFGTPEIDLFASRLNHQVPIYMSWKPDPRAVAVDALSECWKSWFFYAFPPFNIIGKVLQKIEFENSKGILVVPKWTTQTWWPKFLQLSNNNFSLLSRKCQQNLIHPWRKEEELPRMMLVAALVYTRDS